MSSFRNKIVLITGASSGIGAAVARVLAAQGASLVLVARRTDRLAEQVAALAAGGTEALAVAADVTVDGDMERAVAAAVERFGRLDVVYANAGFGVAGRVERLELDDFRRQFETNVFGVLRTFYATIAELKKTRGTFVLTGSVSAYVATPGTAAYSMSKFAVRALADALRGEVAPSGVAVVLINPGFVDSEIRKVDNRGRLHPDAKEPIPGWLRVPTDAAARSIVAPIRRRKAERVVTGHGKLLVVAQRFFPGVLAWAVNRFAGGKRKEPGRTPRQKG